MIRNHMYEDVVVLDDDFNPTDLTVRVLKPEFAKNWKDHLTSEEKRKFDRLSPSAQLSVAIACDPFNALKEIK